eukprot:TRINITY_DN51240_c0_g1_i1.p1 TRINITY_DN51240_c0_g1~~TRINITY_DN51240_c0_g1_i1.p1  ORF type:complete len:442 (+),score=113.04 TRINITY_DN51240_c0_g1_i1:52-1377(+)
MAVTGTGGGNLEQELEYWMEKDEQERFAESKSERTRLQEAVPTQAAFARSQRREAQGPYAAPRLLAAPGLSPYERAMQTLKLSHEAACKREDDIADHCKRCTLDLQRCQKIAKEASETCARTKSAVPASESKLRAAQDHADWLEEVHSHCEKTKAKAIFEPAVMTAFVKAVDHLFETLQLQRGIVKKADSTFKQSKAIHEGSCQDHSSQQQRAEQMQEALRQAEMQLKAAQDDVKDIESKYTWAQSTSKQVEELRDAVRHAEVNCKEAAKARDEAQAKLSQNSAWVEDMRSFFEGHKVKDSDAICSGLESVMRPGDPMPILMRGMLSNSNSIDRTNPTVISLRELVREPIRKVEESLHKQLVAEQQRFIQSQQALENVRQQLRLLEEQLQQNLPLDADSAHPLRPSKAPKAVATPLKCHEARADLQDRLSTGRNLKAPTGR